MHNDMLQKWILAFEICFFHRVKRSLFNTISLTHNGKSFNHFSVVCVRDELMVSTCSGQLLRLRWDAEVNTDMTILINQIPFSTDLQHSRGIFLFIQITAI